MEWAGWVPPPPTCVCCSFSSLSFPSSSWGADGSARPSPPPRPPAVLPPAPTPEVPKACGEIELQPVVKGGTSRWPVFLRPQGGCVTGSGDGELESLMIKASRRLWSGPLGPKGSSPVRAWSAGPGGSQPFRRCRGWGGGGGDRGSCSGRITPVPSCGWHQCPGKRPYVPPFPWRGDT